MLSFTSTPRKIHSFNRNKNSSNAPAGQYAADAGTNVEQFKNYIELFSGPNAAKIYGRHFARWIRRLCQCDEHADYFPFALNTTLPIAKSPESPVFIRAIRQVCEQTTLKLFPTLSRKHPERHPARLSIAVVVLPSVSASGRLHYHGWIRIPRAASQEPASILIRQDGNLTSINCSEALAAFVNALVYDVDAPFRTSGRHFTSFWVQHKNGDAQPAGPNSNEAFRYLRKSADKEIREWTRTEFIPTLVLRKVLNSIQQDRMIRAREINLTRKQR